MTISLRGIIVSGTWKGGGGYFTGGCEGCVKGGSGNGPLQRALLEDLEGDSLTRDFERQMGALDGASLSVGAL